MVAPNLIVTIRHFIADQYAPATGACDVGVSPATEWYAYFRGCPDPGNNPPCLNLCVGPDEDMIRVRIKCFTLATGEFTFPPLPLNDGVVVAEIEPADVCFVAHIAPIPVVRPNDADVDLCMGKPVYIAGWGDTKPGHCTPAGDAGTLRVATAAISYVGCSQSGRYGSIGLMTESCPEGPQCIANGGEHDSGGGVIVEMPDLSLGLVGTIEYPSLAVMSARHQEFTTSPGTDFLCRPCRGLPCADIDGDLVEDCFDRVCLEALGPWEVTPWCLGDLNGDGIAGSEDDLGMVRCFPEDPTYQPACDRNQWCFGDANLDGWVKADDRTLIQQVRAMGIEGTYLCPTCHACPPPWEWCRGDVNFDGLVDATDEQIVIDLLLTTTNQVGYRCYQGADGCVPPETCPEPPPP